MNIALYETDIYWENKRKNIELFKKNIEILVSKADIDLICLPEMSFTGFSMNTEITKDLATETIEQMMDVSYTYGIGVTFGWVEKGKNTCYNHYTLVNDKKVYLDYIKIHPFSYGGETGSFSGGSLLEIGNIQGFNVGFQICYDLRFPEVFQILSKKADLIIIPANWPSTRVFHWDVLLRARAIENQVYIVGINCKGIMNGVEYPGHSCVLKPDGTDIEGEYIDLGDNYGVSIYNIDNDVKEYQNQFPMKSDRRESLYRELMRGDI